MHLLTHQSSDPPQLRVDLADWEGNTAFAKYSMTSSQLVMRTVTTPSRSLCRGTSLPVQLETYSFAFQNGQRFNTPDRDNDASDNQQCAVMYHGPWWHNQCYHSLLTGLYIPGGRRGPLPPNGIHWGGWMGSISLRSAEMKIRPGGV